MPKPTDSPALPVSERWWLRLSVLTMAHVVGTLGMMSILALAPFIQAELKFSATQFGVLIASYAASQAVISPLAGHVGDRVGVGRTLALSMIAIAAGILGFSRSSEFATAILSMAALGIGYAFINPATARGVMDWAPPARRATGMGIKQTGVPVGGILAAGTALLGAALGWRLALACLAAFSLLATLPCFFIAGAPRLRAATATTFLSAWPMLLANRNLGAISVATAGFNICQASSFGFLTLFMKDGIGVTHTLAGLSLGLAQAAAVGGRIAWGIVADRAFSGRCKSLYAYLGASASLLFAILACAQPGWTALAIVGAVLLGLTIGSYAAIVQTMVVEAVAPDQAGTASGYYLFVISLGNMLGPLLFGVLVDLAGYNFGWAFLAIMGSLATAVLIVGFSDQRQWPVQQASTVSWAINAEGRHQ